jgi:multimeric flavodoxin WrbA
MMLLAIVGSVRKGKATDTLVDRTINGALSVNPDMSVKKIYLGDHRISFCNNCLACRNRKTDAPISECSIRDDMDMLSADLLVSDSLIFGTPLHMGYPTALMMAFLERVCWTFAKPEGKILTLSGVPTPRSLKQRKAAVIITNSLVPPILKPFCDNASPVIKDVAKRSLNADFVGTLYAGAIEKRGVEFYLDKANNLGKKLV